MGEQAFWGIVFFPFFFIVGKRDWIESGEIETVSLVLVVAWDWGNSLMHVTCF